MYSMLVKSTIRTRIISLSLSLSPPVSQSRVQIERDCMLYVVVPKACGASFRVSKGDGEKILWNKVHLLIPVGDHSSSKKCSVGNK
jgi:hypothetical protein